MWKLVKIPSIMVNQFLIRKVVWFGQIIFWFLSNLRQSLDSTRTYPQWPVSSFSTWRCVQLWNHPFWNCNSWFTLQHVRGLVSSGYVFCANLWKNYEKETFMKEYMTRRRRNIEFRNKQNIALKAKRLGNIEKKQENLKGRHSKNKESNSDHIRELMHKRNST